MIIPGKILNGVVVLEDGFSLPEGTDVTVVSPLGAGEPTNLMDDAERRRVLAIAERIAAVPDENPDDRVSGSDHDRFLYGTAE